jgi:large subunit ribosomal protein L10
VQAKAEEVQEIKQLMQQCDVIGVAGLEKVRAAQLQALRKKLRDRVSLRVIKNTLVERAMAETKEKPGLENLKNHMGGSNIFLFTNLSPFKLALLLQKSRVQTTARAGDVASHDVTVPAGNTGLPPGPIISQFGTVGVPTRIEAGSVWINRDTLVVKEGETITARLAAVLSKLGITPVEIGLTLKASYDDGLVIPEEQLLIDLETTRRSLEEAHRHAFNLTLNTVYPLPENASLLLQIAHQKAFTLALNVALPTPDVISALVRRAHLEMLSLSIRLAKVDEKAAPQLALEKG